MKERPFIFSTPMVRALLNTQPNIWPAEPIDPDRPYKCMTRRVVTRIDGVGPITEFGESDTLGYKWHFRDKRLKWHDAKSVMPPYKIGYILWVRETFTKTKDGDYIYRSDPMFDGMDKGDFSWTWTSPLFLPRKAAQILLEVKNVRIKRVQDITEEDAKAEGVERQMWFRPHGDSDDESITYGKGFTPCYKNGFAHIWENINGKKYPWDSNPWVWVYEFMRVS
jgi:hypothetical protein